METLVRKHIILHLESNNLISGEQHGFVAGRSCVTNLLETLDDWTEIIGSGGTVDVIYMDFMKAFDTVPHRRLLAKIEAHGIQDKVQKWIAAFLSGRQQRVCINGVVSEPASVSSGIPQGSVLGPVLFALYINDLPTKVHGTAKLFADDTKLYTQSDLQDAPAALQDDLDRLQKWSDDWLLRFHPEKCKVMKLGKSPSSAEYTMRQTTPDGGERTITLEETEMEKDLGVFVDKQLSFKSHISKAVTKANTRCY